MDEMPPFTDNEYDNWITKRVNGILEHGPAYEPHPRDDKTLEDWASWVGQALRHETGLTLSEKQEMVVLRGFYFAFLRRGFRMCYCPEEAEACQTK